jgi:hypothetical protein
MVEVLNEKDACGHHHTRHRPGVLPIRTGQHRAHPRQLELEHLEHGHLEVSHATQPETIRARIVDGPLKPDRVCHR